MRTTSLTASLTAQQMLAVLAFNIVGDGLRDAFDPRAEMR